MATKAGVWIDHKQANVVLVNDQATAITKVVSNADRPRRPAGGSTKSKTSHTLTSFVAEDRREHKAENDRKRYFDAVIAAMRGADELLVLGPGEAKGEFAKHLQAKKLRTAVTIETADKVTDRQLVAKVQQHFAATAAQPPKKKAPPKSAKPVKKSAKPATKTKASSTAPAKRAKKSST